MEALIPSALAPFDFRGQPDPSRFIFLDRSLGLPCGAVCGAGPAERTWWEHRGSNPGCVSGWVTATWTVRRPLLPWSGTPESNRACFRMRFAGAPHCHSGSTAWSGTGESNTVFLESESSGLPSSSCLEITGDALPLELPMSRTPGGHSKPASFPRRNGRNRTFSSAFQRPYAASTLHSGVAD